MRKSFATVSTIGPAVLCVAMTQLEDNFRVVVIIYIATCVIWGTYAGSDPALPIDLAAEYSGAVSALQGVASNAALISVPIFVGWYIEEKVRLTFGL